MLDRLMPIDDDILARIDALDLSFNEFGIDPYGIDRMELARWLTAVSFMYRFYFRVDIYGMENVPGRGRGMLIGNHSGGVAIDGMIVGASMMLDHEPPRLAHAMIEQFIHRFPGASQVMARTGQFTGNPDQAARLLEDERLVLTFPEGARGTAKLAKDADTLVRFGTGFMRLALATRTPILPFGFVGGGEAMPTVANLRMLGRLMGVPYIPVTSYLLPLPKPTSFQLIFGKPMHFEGTGNERDEVIVGLVDQVKARIQKLIEQGRALRRKKLSPEQIEYE